MNPPISPVEVHVNLFVVVDDVDLFTGVIG